MAQSVDQLRLMDWAQPLVIQKQKVLNERLLMRESDRINGIEGLLWLFWLETQERQVVLEKISSASRLNGLGKPLMDETNDTAVIFVSMVLLGKGRKKIPGDVWKEMEIAREIEQAWFKDKGLMAHAIPMLYGKVGVNYPPEFTRVDREDTDGSIAQRYYDTYIFLRNVRKWMTPDNLLSSTALRQLGLPNPGALEPLDLYYRMQEINERIVWPQKVKGS